MSKASDEDELAVLLGIAGFVYFDPTRRLYLTRADWNAQEKWRKSREKNFGRFEYRKNETD